MSLPTATLFSIFAITAGTVTRRRILTVRLQRIPIIAEMRLACFSCNSSGQVPTTHRADKIALATEGVRRRIAGFPTGPAGRHRVALLLPRQTRHLRAECPSCPRPGATPSGRRTNPQARAVSARSVGHRSENIPVNLPPAATAAVPSENCGDCGRPLMATKSF